MEQNKDQIGAVIAWMRPDEIEGLLAAAQSESATRQYGRVYAKQYDPDMVPVCGAAVRGEAVACKFCDGEGVIHTGIDEAPSRECQRCDGSGIAPVSARAADAPSEPSEKLYFVRMTKTDGWREASEAAYWTFSEVNRRILYESRAADALDSQPTDPDTRDAARYRLLRDGGNHDYRLCKWVHSGVQVMKRLDGEELDRALDQAAADHKASWMTKATERASSQPTDGGVRNG